MITRLGAAATRHPRRTIALWALGVVLSVLAAPLLFDSLTTDMGDDAGTESAQADARIAELRRSLPGGDVPQGSTAYAVVDGLAIDDPDVAAAMDAAVAAIDALPGVVEAKGPGDLPALAASDGMAAAVVLELAPGGDEDEERTQRAVEAELRWLGAGEVLIGSEDLLDSEIEAQAERDLARGEAIALPIAFVALVLVFGGLLAALLPLALAVGSIAGALAVLLAASAAGDVAAYALNVVTMLGIGLGVDYGLLLVSRFREERRHGLDVDVAVARSVATAGRTVAFSGLTVAVSLAGLLVFPSDGLRSLAIGGIGVVLVAVLAAVTLLPALLVLAGHRVRPGRSTTRHGVFWHLAGWVRRHALAVVVAVGAVLAATALPFLGARFENPDARSLPESSVARRLEDLRARFPDAEATEPIVVLAETSPDDPDLAAWVGALAEHPGVAAVDVDDSLAGTGATLVDVVPEGTGEGEVAQRLVHELRTERAPFPVLVGGDAAELVDLKDSIAARLPWALLVVIAATMVLLFAMTGSVVVPIKAVLMNLLSLGATFGALVLVFQDGHLSGLLGFDSVGALDATIPLVVFLFAFGLSMDYEVFLLARIKEAWDETGDNDLAIATGLDRTGRIITSAAGLLVIVFAGFAAGELVLVKQLGVGLAVAVLVDVTIVRCLLVPATMTLMGRWNWWAPGPLRRLHARISLVEPGTDHGQQPDDDADRAEHEEDLVPAALVGEHRLSSPPARG